MNIQDYVRKTEIGIHTISLYAGNLKYHEVQKAIDRQMEKRKIQVRKKDPYNIDRSLKDIYFLNEGITLWIYQSHDKSNGISFVVNPSTLQKGKYQPAKLWKPTKKVYKSMVAGLDKCIDALGLECTADDLSLSQMDLTMNLWLDDEADMDEIIRLFQKCKFPRHFKRVHLKDKKADRHYFGIRANDVLVKVYDKIFELQYNDRCPSKFAKKNLLRIEVSLKREAFLEKLLLERGDNLYDMLEAGYGQAKSVMEGYLHKMFPCTGEFVSYKQAKRAIETGVKNQKLQEQMLYLLKKTSHSAGLDTAVRILKDHYKNVNHQRIKKLFAEFEELGINPITLTKS